MKLLLPCLLLILGASPLAAEQTPELSQLLPAPNFQVVKLQRTPDHHLYISGRLEGRRCSCLVDTGWSQSSVASRSQTGRVAFAELRLGELTITNFMADCEPVTMGGQPASFDVVLGLDFLRTQRAIIDCGAARLYLHPAAPSPAARDQLERDLSQVGYTVVELQAPQNAALTCTGRVADRSIEFMVDSAAAWSCLDMKSAISWGLKPHPSTTVLAGAGGTGKRPLPVAEVRILELGNLRVNRPVLGLVELADWGIGKPDTALRNTKGLLAGDLLGKYRAVIDCDGRKLWLKSPGSR